MTRFLAPRRTSLPAALVALAVLAACGDPTGDPPTDVGSGTLTVVVNATGTNIDQQYSIQLNGGEAQSYVSGTPFIRELTASVHNIRISGIASNCTLQGEEMRQVSLLAGQERTVTFVVTCTAG